MTSISVSHSGQARISPSSTSSSSTSISVAHLGHRTTAKTSLGTDSVTLLLSYYITRSVPRGKRAKYDDTEARIPGTTPGGRGRRGDRSRARVADPARQPAAGRPMVDPGRDARVGRDTDAGRRAGTRGRNRAPGKCG